MTRVWPIAMLILLVGCDQLLPKDGVGEVLGLKFGVPLDLTIKEGPRDPPVFRGYLREFYEVNFPNMEFNFVGVAVTKNDDVNRKEGVFFVQEKLIWGAMFHNTGPCEEKDFLRTKQYLEKNWKISLVKENRNKSNENYLLDATFTSPSVVWELSCGIGLGRTLVIMDYSVLKKAGDDNTKKHLDKVLSDLNAMIKRKM